MQKTIVVVALLSIIGIVPAMSENRNEYGPNLVKETVVPGLGVLKIGSKVSHPKFGIGTVQSIELNDSSTTSNIIFKSHGSKWLVVEFANLSLIAN
jgi:DNA helicase-2/ATP-dependent DNA helicase PcrA